MQIPQIQPTQQLLRLQIARLYQQKEYKALEQAFFSYAKSLKDYYFENAKTFEELAVAREVMKHIIGLAELAKRAHNEFKGQDISKLYADIMAQEAKKDPSEH